MTDDLDERSMEDLDGMGEVLGANGTSFENAYVTYSLCCPSRDSILRGQYPHNHNILDNSSPQGGEGKFRNSGLDRSTVATWLNDAGYQTKYIGKYMNGYGGLYVPRGWDEWYVLQDAHGADVTDKPASGAPVRTVTFTGHSTDVFANKASDFIQRSSANSKPFFLLVAPTAPHIPPQVAARHQDQFTTTPLPHPDNFNEDNVLDKPAWVRSRSVHSQSVIDEMLKEYRARLRSMLSVEDLLRQTIATLDQTGELENTYIFFTSDNGFHLGNHRLGIAKRSPYEEDIGVPLMVRGPGIPPNSVSEELVLNNDFAPTIADLAGASTPSFVDGSSFAPLLTSSPPSSWRTAFLEEGWYPESNGFKVPTHKSVHTQDHMFTEYATGEYELYDLNADPYQLDSKRRTGNELLYSTLQTRLNALRACSGAACRSAEWGTITPPTDTTSPRVTSTSPKHAATGVAPSANLTATFSEKMDPASITNSTFKLFKLNPDGSTTQVTDVSVSLSTDGLKATLDPFGTSTTTHLANGTKYKGEVTTGARDEAGNQLDQHTTTTGLQEKTWTFTVSQ